jgi:hypothetical protein
MSDFTPDEMMTLRVATRTYMEAMRSNAIQFKDDPDTGHYFASEAERAEELWNKLVQMDVESIGKERKALQDAIDDENRADYSDWQEDRDASDSLPHLDTFTSPKTQYNDRPLHGPF